MGARETQVVSLSVKTSDNLQIKKKGEEKQYKTGATLAPDWCSGLDLVVPGRKMKMTTHNTS